MLYNEGFIEPYTPLVFLEDTLISAKNLNNLGNQYLSGKYLVDNHNHGDIYYTKEEADLRYFHSENKSGSDADMVDGSHLADLTGSALPKYSVIAWESATIPAGYALCNGQVVEGVSTPDLRDYFIPCAGDDYTLNQILGSNVFNLSGSITVDNHTLTIAELPNHRHSYDDWYVTSGQASSYDTDMGASTNNDTNITSGNVGGGGAHNHTGSITFDQQSSDNRPKYYAIYFIMKVI
jgi:hypothetical protein